MMCLLATSAQALTSLMFACGHVRNDDGALGSLPVPGICVPFSFIDHAWVFGRLHHVHHELAKPLISHRLDMVVLFTFHAVALYLFSHFRYQAVVPTAVESPAPRASHSPRSISQEASP